MEKKYEKRMEVRSERRVENYGADIVKGLGTVSQGISPNQREGGAESLVPLKNKFSALHDTSMKEAMRMVGGKGTSYQENE